MPELDEQSRERRGTALPATLPIVPVTQVNLFPRMVIPVVLEGKKHRELVDEVVNTNKLVGFLAYKEEPATPDGPETRDMFHKTGVAAQVLRMITSENGDLSLVIQGLTRFHTGDFVSLEPFIKARVEMAPETHVDDVETKALMSNLRSELRKVVKLSPNLPEEMESLITSVPEPGALCDMVSTILSMSPEERQGVLAALDVKERLHMIREFVNREIQVLELGSKLQNQVKEGLDKTQREYYLRQQLKAIQKELGEEADETQSEVEEFRRRLDEKKLTEQARQEADRELKRLANMHPSSSEYHVITTYLDWLASLPWEEYSEDQLDIKNARAILEADHHGLEKVKKRILEYLAVRKLNPDMKGPILCLAGPPGVGKTSLGRSIARAMGREFVRISLGGVRDEAEIRGHRRTYVGALPGRIIQSLRRAGTANPVFMLDEVDKVGADFRGDPTSALLEVLDPEQNFSFSDHYLDVTFDLSKVMFIATANVLDTIPAPLRDRMEILHLPGYTANEKLKIAKRYLVPRQRKEHGLTGSDFSITDAAVTKVIERYTREAGVRNLEREIGSICRYAARTIAEGEAERVSVGVKKINAVLGPEKITPDTALRTSVPGVATGLAWTPTGGDILFIEASAMPGKGGLVLTGQLGDVMKESALAAVSYVRANADLLKVDPDFHKENDLHIHVPAGAIPKDGPSAGVTMLTALVSLLTNRSVDPEMAMTGEITLRGMVLPVGGIKEKILAAHRAGIKKVILPKQNERDLADVPKAVKNSMEFYFAERMDQVVKRALVKPKSNK
ncbi:Lon protease [Dethiosulfatarculus sandiegensis]|uniref:Lon protease n=1 Tax=Dethiosulfatarculus sandiegensis TaxID=1429043 RepID=A0A0D2GI95_9BACT|nr:Lon protease [Dethiosulfatarculus sandiegensis]